MAAASQSDSNDNDAFSSIFGVAYLEPYVQCHLMSVYDCLAGGMLLAASGIYFHLFTNIGDSCTMCTVAAVVFVLCVVFTYHTNENVTERMGAFNAFTFFSGVSSGPLFELAAKIDPSIICNAVSFSAIVITSLSLAALSTSDRKFANYGVLLYSLFFLLILVEVVNSHIGSRVIFDMYLYSSLVLFAIFTVYDMQMTVEKRIQGEADFVWHSVALFLDTFHMFKLIVIVLAKRAKSQIDAQGN